MTKIDHQFVNSECLEKEIKSADCVVLDCSWYLPETGKQGFDDFLEGHIPGARYLDLDRVSDKRSKYVNMVPTADQFAAEMSALGISNQTSVVVYDAGYVSARIWWMFRLFGHDRVRILDGGWRKWKSEGRPVESGPSRPHALGSFTAVPREGWVADWREVLAAVKGGSPNLVDARTPERYSGAMSSGYPGVPGGHIPGAVNAPWSKFMDAAAGYAFVSPESAEVILRDVGVDLDKPVIVTCGSGVTAAIIALMLERTGRVAYRMYDGSWHEWGQRADLPKTSVQSQTASDSSEST